MSNSIRIVVEKVNGYCSCKYKEGDVIKVNGYMTPNKFCGGAYTTLFPIIVVFNSGGTFEFEDDPLCKTEMACPDKGNIIFNVKKYHDKTFHK